MFETVQGIYYVRYFKAVIPQSVSKKRIVPKTADF